MTPDHSLEDLQWAKSENLRHAMALKDSHGTVKDYFILVHEPGRAPDKKRPPVPTSDGAERMLCELLNCRPAARLTLARLTWDDDLWVDDGHSTLSETAISAGVSLPNGGEAKLRHYDPRGWEVWVRSPGQPRARKAAGPFHRSIEGVDAICGPIWTAASIPPGAPEHG